MLHQDKCKNSLKTNQVQVHVAILRADHARAQVRHVEGGQRGGEHERHERQRGERRGVPKVVRAENHCGVQGSGQVQEEDAIRGVLRVC